MITKIRQPIDIHLIYPDLLMIYKMFPICYPILQHSIPIPKLIYYRESAFM